MHTQTLAIRLLENDVQYKPEQWAGKLLGAGCYPYAANFQHDALIKIGTFIGKPCGKKTTDEVLIATLKEELIYMGYTSVEEVSTDYVAKPGERKIYLSRTEQSGAYHMYRQDDDGHWSHKYPNEKPTNRDSSGELISDPEDMIEAPYYGWCFLLKRD